MVPAAGTRRHLAVAPTILGGLLSALFDYEIIEQLHASARSVVYRARSVDDRRALIVKIPNTDFPSFHDTSRFKREYALARRCDHTGLIRPLALGLHGGRWTMILDDIGAIALKQILSERVAARTTPAQAPFPLDDFYDIALQLCAALEALHGQGIIHKDINPSNLVWNDARRHLQLIDFGIASELAQETQGIVAPHALEGTLAYMAPEQTGRMNRLVDYRADYYALGATFYALLTGQAPFAGDDPMTLVHCQLAHHPDWTHPALAALPAALPAILQRLLEKDAEQRYQTLHGLRADLEACRAGAAPQVLGGADRHSRFTLSQKLHGRAREVEALLAAFGRTAVGASELLLVTGYSGIGKSALVNEVQRSIVARRGRFLAGKFDQYRRETPYASLTLAFGELIRQLLGEPDERLRAWADRVRTALGANLGVMVELMPELALLVGACAPVSAVPPEQEQPRMNRVFRSFIEVFASAEQPLVLFLDDLQWADRPTLELIEQFLAAHDAGHVLVIGAYRDNEVDASHALTALRERVPRMGVRLTDLTLGALGEAHVAQWLGESLRVSPEACAPLARLCHQKTGGNPFFLGLFLHAIHDAGHLRYRSGSDCWGWDLAALERADYTDNVVALLLETIRRLPAETQKLLQFGAALGNPFRLDTLALLVARTPAATQQALWPAFEARLIQPLDQSYKYLGADADADADADAGADAHASGVGYRFLHDRVQQACHAIAGDDERAAMHLRIGRLRLRHANEQQLGEQLFSIVEHLNAGRARMTAADERLRLAQLNLQAGLKARRSAAFQATLAFMRTGLELLPEDGWRRHADLWLDLQLGVAEASYLCGQFDAADAIYPALLARCVQPLQQARCAAVQAHQYQLQGRLREAIVVLRAGLARLGIELAEDSAELQASSESILADIARQHDGADTDTLLGAAEMSDPTAIATMQMMLALWTASYYAGQRDLSEIMVLSMTRLSIRQGSSDFSPVAYVGYAYVLTLRGAGMELGYQFGAMALTLARRRASLHARTLTTLMFAALTSHWTRPLRSSDALYDEALGYALESADFVQVGVVAAVRATERLILGDYLPELLTAIERDLTLMRANGQQAMADCCMAGAVQPIKCLLGLTARGDCYDDDSFSEARFLDQYAGSALFHAYFLQGKIRNAYLFDGADAEALAGQLEIVNQIMRGQAKVPESAFYAALIWLRALRRDPRRADADAIVARLTALQALLEAWAALGPHTIGARHLLVRAEWARWRDELTLATRYYQQAIDAAGSGGYVQLQALGNELCGECWLDQGQPRVAAVYLHDAMARYRQWGAEGKCAQLSARHAGVLAGAGARARVAHGGSITHSDSITHSGSITYSHGSRSRGDGNAALDLASILKAAQALSNEIGLRAVLGRLIAIVRENSGAQVARLLLLDDGVCRLEADIVGADVTLMQGRAVALDSDSDPQFPLSLLRYVMRTGDEVIEERIAVASRFATDPYVRLHRPRSVMCLPIRHGGRLGGMLYLENNLAEAAFTLERVEFLRILGGQALISIAHARLHDSLERRVAERTAELEEANRKLATLSATDGLTGLANRRHFDEVLRAELARARRSGEPLAVIMVDVDHFKKFNDCYGHQNGDDCLIRVAFALQTGTRRASDLAARYGGEEFSIVLPNTSAALALQMGEALRGAIEQLGIEHRDASSGKVTISVGVAVCLQAGAADGDVLMRAADAALYRAKDGGRNRVVLSAEAL
jgi:diguanylate cyclase (GGDEF)-like protein